MKKNKFPVMPESIDMILAGLACALVFYYWFGIWGVLPPVLFIAFVLYFFRNPKREYIGPENDLISPADGVIQYIGEVDENRYIKGRTIKISIFMNVFNVHVNRLPIDANIEYVDYVKGKFLPAFKSHASDINERNYLGISSLLYPDKKILLVQITGFIARRIVCWAKPAEKYSRGDLFGLIKFGSCVEIYVPLGTDIIVQCGQKVRGGETVLGRIKNE